MSGIYQCSDCRIEKGVLIVCEQHRPKVLTPAMAAMILDYLEEPIRDGVWPEMVDVLRSMSASHNKESAEKSVGLPTEGEPQ